MRFSLTSLVAVIITGLCISPPIRAAEPKSPARKENYDQWRMALSKDGVTNPVEIKLPPDYEISIVRVAEPDEGSWINLAFDPKGQLIVSREDKGLLRFTLADDHKSVAKVETVEDTLLECRGLLFAHDSLYVSANNSKGVYRLKDTDGDDTFDDVKLLKTLEGGVGHGRNCLALGPDGKIYLACGNNVKVPEDISPKSPYRNYGLDRLLPCHWNEFLFDADVVPPAGFVLRTDAEGKEWELFAGGFRNEYGLAFNPDGELFTYDADMEWDEGAPWYRPTCVMHVVSGGEYGWRQGTSVWPEFFTDSLPRVVDVGLGSPTAVAFGTQSTFPEKYRRALFILDWAYGRIIAVHLTPDGASYKGETEEFITGKPLNVTGIAFGPDGCMYFTVGGRKTQSALYRVKFTGELVAEAPMPETESTVELRAFRRELDAIRSQDVPDKLAKIQEASLHSDRFIRFASRMVLERFPSGAWDHLFHKSPVKYRTLERLIASARLGGPNHQYGVILNFSKPYESMDADNRTRFWRSKQLALTRYRGAKSSVDLINDSPLGLPLMQSCYPVDNFAENHLLCELLVYLKSPDVIEKTLKLLDAAPNQQEKLFYLFTLRHMKEGWTLDQRRDLLKALRDAEKFDGAQYMQRYVAFIRTDYLSAFTPLEHETLAAEIAALGQTSSGNIAAKPRPLVKQWTLDELTALLDRVTDQRNRERGKELFADAHCAQCHRREKVGRPIGPDLDSAAAKFSRKDLLETIVHPSKVVEGKYRLEMIETDDGQALTGQLVGGDAEMLALAPSPLEPTRMVRVRRDQIESRTTSPTSIMPDGLLNTLMEDEILDLLAYLEFGSE